MIPYLLVSSPPSGFPSVAARLAVYVGGTAALVFAAAILYSYDVSRNIVLEDAEQRARLSAEAQANDLEEVLRSIEEGTRLLASTLEHTTVSPSELEAVIESFVEGNPKVFGSAAAVAPDRAVYASSEAPLPPITLAVPGELSRTAARSLA